MRQALLEVRNLNIAFETSRGLVRPVRNVSFSIYPGQTVAIVGESGCGKSVTAMSILRLIPSPPGRVLDGQVLLTTPERGTRDLLGLPEQEMRGRPPDRRRTPLNRGTATVMPAYHSQPQFPQPRPPHPYPPP